jgi:cytochrome c oxidase subunit 2
MSTALTVVIAVGAASCSSDPGDLSEQAARGRQTSISNGCASCHGTDGQGGVGPSWVGLAGSEFELADGSTMVADDAYLLRSILDPAAEIVPGYSVNMPQNALTEDQALDIVAYIDELADPE